MPEAPSAPKFFIRTFGCQMNISDSERMSALLAEQGMTVADKIEDAQVILINGCTVRDKADHKAFSNLGELRELKKGYPHAFPSGPIIGLGGCVGQLDKGRIFSRAPYLDFVFGTDAIDQLPEILHRVKAGEKHLVYTDFDRSMDYSTETKIFIPKAQAFVNIMKGCDKHCTYCIVPTTRGREKSRAIAEVVSDVSRLVAQGVREVTLLGQNVNSFGKGQFVELLRAIDTDPRCEKLKRIRFTSSHPMDFSDELVECYASPEKGGISRLAAHLHLPVQSGSNRILQKMARHHQIESYIAQLDRLRALNPDVGFTTDLIVGFPGETEEDFQATLDLLARVQFDNIYAFAYSSRPGTRASKLEDDVPESEKRDRLNMLLGHQLAISGPRYATRVGKAMEILVEGESKNQSMAVDMAVAGPSDNNVGRVWTGRTSCNCVVNFMAPAGDAAKRNLTGQFVQVKITAATSLSLKGELA